MNTWSGPVVAMIVSGRMYGGGQRVATDLSGVAERQGDAVRIVFLGVNSSLYVTERTMTVPYDGRYNHIVSLGRTAYKLRRQVSRERFAIIHTHGWDADVIGWLAVRGLKVPQLVHLHVKPAWLKSRKLKHAIRRYLTRCVLCDERTRVVAVSNAVRRYWAKFLPIEESSVRTIHNGVDVSVYRSDCGGFAGTANPLVIGAAARLVAGKGVEYLLEAIARLVGEGHAVRLRIAGDGGLRRALEHRARDLRVSEAVEFLGHVEDMPSFFRSIDIFVCPSFSEGMPIAVLEAMAAAIPIVATNVGGIPEAVNDGVEGFLVSPGDSDELASALHHLISDTRLRYTMGLAAANCVQGKFTIEASYEKLSSIYAGMYAEAADGGRSSTL